ETFHVLAVFHQPDDAAVGAYQKCLAVGRKDEAGGVAFGAVLGFGGAGGGGGGNTLFRRGGGYLPPPGGGPPPPPAPRFVAPHHHVAGRLIASRQHFAIG